MINWLDNTWRRVLKCGSEDREMDKNTGNQPVAPLVHGKMFYRCAECGKIWPMYLEKGIEEFGEKHKPSPFMIVCPHCEGWAMDVSGIQKVPDGGYMSIPDGAGYFANVEDKDCGVPVFPAPPMDEVESLLQDEDMVNAIEYVKGIIKAETADEIERVFRMLAIDAVYPIKGKPKLPTEEVKESIIGIMKSVGMLAAACMDADVNYNGGDLAWDESCFVLPPPLSKLERLWRAQRRRADRERQRVLLKYLEWRYSIKRRKVYATGRSNCDSAVLPGYSAEDEAQRAGNALTENEVWDRRQKGYSTRYFTKPSCAGTGQ